MAVSHETAVRADLVTLTRYTLEDVGGGLPWGDFASFLRHLPPTSATYREINGERANWDSGLYGTQLTACLIDEVRALGYMIACVYSREGSVPEKPDRFPRPWEPKKEHRKFDVDAFRKRLHEKDGA